MRVEFHQSNLATTAAIAWGSEASAYVAGFPCTPYSLLSVTRRMLHDVNAQQLFRVLKRLRRYRPKVSLPELEIEPCDIAPFHLQCIS